MSHSFAILGSRGYPSTYGGFETLVRRLAPYLAENGDTVTVYGRDEQPGSRVVDDVRCISTRGVDSNSFSTLSYGLTSVRHARRGGYDAALVLNIANGYYLKSLQQAHVPTAVNVDGIEWERGKWGKVGRAVFRKAADLTARRADEIVVDSVEIGRIWQRQFSRVGTYIPYGADIVEDLPTNRLEQIGLKPGSYALVVARLVPENNVDLFLDSLDVLDESTPAVVVGSAPAGSPIANRLLARASARPNFLWLGHVSDQEFLSQLWSHCAVYFHGHSVGGTNPALLQALGHGAPTIALDTPFNREVINDERQLVTGRPSEVSRELRTVIGDAALQRGLADAGHQIIRSRFRWHDVLERYRNLLIQLATTNGRSIDSSIGSKKVLTG